MQDVPGTVVSRFADAFAYGRAGYTLSELHDIFVQYQADAPPVPPSSPPTKGAYFADCLYRMAPEKQRQFLYDLCDNPPPAKGSIPGQNERLELLGVLAAADGVAPLGVTLAGVSVRAVRNQWFSAAERLPGDPAAAVTAARTLLESTCKTILVELGVQPDNSGQLVRLYKQVRVALALERVGGSQGIHQVAQGLVQVASGVAELSNAAGDRHGLAGGVKSTDHIGAALAVHAAGTVSLYLVQVHRAQARTSQPV